MQLVFHDLACTVQDVKATRDHCENRTLSKIETRLPVRDWDKENVRKKGVFQSKVVSRYALERGINIHHTPGMPPHGTKDASSAAH